MKIIYRQTKQFLQKTFPDTYTVAERYKVYIKYCLSGGTAAVTDLSLLYVLTDVLGVWYLISAAVAFIISFCVSFVLQKFWTFRDSGTDRMHAQLALYLTGALVNLSINAAGIYFLVEYYRVWYLLAQVIMGAALALFSFVLYKFVIFSGGSALGGNRNMKKIVDKNILICTGIYPPDIGGPATYSQLLYEELSKYGYSVKVVTYSDAGQNKSQVQNSNEPNIYRISRQQPKILRYFKYFWQVLKLLNWANIVYAQGPVSDGLPVYWACRLRGRRYILKIVGDYAWEQYQNAKYQAERRDVALPRLNTEFITVDEFQNKTFDAKTERKRRVQKKVAKRAEKIIVPSEYLKNIVQQWGVGRDKINVVYNAVRYRHVEPKHKEAGEKWIVTVGRLVPWKGMDTLLEVMPEIRRTEPTVKLFILGDGPAYGSLRARRDELGLKGSVGLQGQLPYNDVAAFLAAADAFVLNSAYEGLSHVLLEAIMAGAPVVVSNACGNPEVIRCAGRGHIVAYNDRVALQRAIIAALQEERHPPADDFLRIFNRDAMVKRTIEVLTS